VLEELLRSIFPIPGARVRRDSRASPVKVSRKNKVQELVGGPSQKSLSVPTETPRNPEAGAKRGGRSHNFPTATRPHPVASPRRSELIVISTIRSGFIE
jgi:hypothetical protein